jgi:two-component system, sensor histidine kinase LadS
MKKASISLFSFLIICISNIYLFAETGIYTQSYQIHKNLSHLKDSSNTIDISKAIQLQKLGEFEHLKSKTNRQEFGYNTAAHWFYFQLKSSEKTELMLELEYNNMDHLELFEVKNGIKKKISKAGDIYPFSLRPYSNNNYVFPIQLRANELSEYYLFINPPNSIFSFTIELSNRAKFTENDRREYILWGIYIGIICIVMVVNLVMWLVTRDKIYIWYTLFIHFMTMHLFADAGLAFQYLWPNKPEINAFHPVYLYIWLGLIMQVIFMQKFINQNAKNSKVYYVLKWFRLFVLACFVGVILVRISGWNLGNTYLFKSIATMSAIFVPIVFVLSMISLYERRNESEILVKYYGWAVFIQFFGYMFVAFITYIQATNINFTLPFDILSYIIIGSVLLFDILFFSFGLSYRYKLSLKKNQKMALQLIDEKQKTQLKIIDAFTEERRRLSQDLHDEIGATLSTAKGYLSMLYRQSPNDFLAKSTEILDKASQDIRSISHQLMPNNFEEIGLAAAISESINKLNNSEVFQFVTMGTPKKLNPQSEVLLFSMTTDILAKIQSQITENEIIVQLIYHENELNLSFEYTAKLAYLFDENHKNLFIKTSFLKGFLNIDSYKNNHSIMLTVPFEK